MFEALHFIQLLHVQMQTLWSRLFSILRKNRNYCGPDPRFIHAVLCSMNFIKSIKNLLSCHVWRLWCSQMVNGLLWSVDQSIESTGIWHAMQYISRYSRGQFTYNSYSQSNYSAFSLHALKSYPVFSHHASYVVLVHWHCVQKNGAISKSEPMTSTRIDEIGQVLKMHWLVLDVYGTIIGSSTVELRLLSIQAIDPNFGLC